MFVSLESTIDGFGLFASGSSVLPSTHGSALGVVAALSMLAESSNEIRDDVLQIRFDGIDSSCRLLVQSDGESVSERRIPVGILGSDIRPDGLQRVR